MHKINISSIRSKSWGIGIGFGALHIALIVIFLVVVGFGVGGESRLLWALWIPIDFPVSMLVALGLEHIPMTTDGLQTLLAWWPLIVHGIFGTVWWFVLPFTVSRVLERLNRSKLKV